MATLAGPLQKTLEDGTVLYVMEDGMYLASGSSSASAAASVDAMHAAGQPFKSFLTLLPHPPHASELQACIEAAGAAYRQVPVEVPADLTKEKALELHSTLSALPKPVWVQCASGNRASAGVLLHLALTAGWTAADALAYAQAHHYKFASNEVLRNWVVRVLHPAAPHDLSGSQPRDVIFRQLFDAGASSTFTYVLGDPKTMEAVIIDPVLERVDRDATVLAELGLHLTFALNTHVHADHVSGTHALKKKLPLVKSVVAAVTGAVADVHVGEGDRIPFGTRFLRVLSTPGHTDGCLTYVLDDDSMAFTGDALFVRGCGRTDFQQGNAARLYDSVHTKIFALPESCVIYPGHDYNGHERSTVAEEIRFNPRLNKSKQEFIAIMGALGLAKPKLIDIAVPANMKDGVIEA